ncbi:PepSY-associated TM helix domain-containing protein [Methylomonas sp. AM2-LC]|uniref:PepSY-associated TM helix domain-containing protein n=1 Tax=Methylomonas sp. AM2-LC TaxID=3153301 RepID=UPI003267988E
MVFFLSVAGLSGSLLAFYQEINARLNPEIYHIQIPADKAPLDSFALRKRAEVLVPDGQINWIPLHRLDGESFIARFQPRMDMAGGTSHTHEIPRILALNPYTGDEIVRIQEGWWPLTRQNLMDFIYALHWSLALGEPGQWLLGIAAAIWTMDCFVGFYLTLPIRRKVITSGQIKVRPKQLGFWQRWSLAWKVKWWSSAHRVNFDLHRAGGLWTWVMLFIFAWSSVAFNLGEQVYMPVMKFCCGMPDPVKNLPVLTQPKPKPGLAWQTAYSIGQQHMADQTQARGVAIQHESLMYYDEVHGIFYYNVHSDLDVGESLGSTSVIFDGDSGMLLAFIAPTGQNGALTFTNWITNLHMAKVFGFAMQVFVCLMGLVVTILSVTGVYLWLKKRRSERLRQKPRKPSMLATIGKNC